MRHNQHLKFNILILFLFLPFVYASAQFNKLGSWREHLPYDNGRLVEEGNNEMFCATQYGLFSYHFDDNSIERISKLNGLNDFGIAALRYSKQNNVLVIGYRNANIDLLFDDRSVLNIPDIKRKNIQGLKSINSINIQGNLAYLACGFGIVVIDLKRREIKDSYFIGDKSTPVDIGQVAFDNQYIYAAGDNGVYQGNINDPFLANYANWTMIRKDTSNAGSYNFAVVFNNILYVNFTTSAGDSVLAYNGSWGAPLPSGILQNADNRSMRISEGNLVLCNNFSASFFNSSLTRIRYIDGSSYTSPQIFDGVKSSDGRFWIADGNKGLIKFEDAQAGFIMPEGPGSYKTSAMQSVNNKLWVIHGPRNRSWTNDYELNGFSSYKEGHWTNYNGYTGLEQTFFTSNNFLDNTSLAVFPSDENHFFTGSEFRGLMEFKDGSPYKLYTDTNSTLKGQFGNVGQIKVHGIALDQDNNLWVSNAGVNSVINLLKTDGTWKSYLFPGLINSSSKTGDMIIDDIGEKWLVLFENIGSKDGILVFNDHGTPDDLTDDESGLVEFGNNRVRCMVKDKDGVVWAGTEEGVYIFYPPSLQPQQILIRQDNTYQYLLATESVITMAVDAANQKWIGTEFSGVFVLSPDGLTQVAHFTIDNSPLFSNTVRCITIDGKTGEVYMGTDEGMISYQGVAVESNKACDGLTVYPNPVKQNYLGPIAIRGLTPNGTVKVTDVNGGLVYEGKSLGSQFTWNGRNLRGDRVQTGMYLVFSSDEAGGSQCTAKVMIEN